MNPRLDDVCSKPNSRLKRINITSRALGAALAILAILGVAQPASAATILVNADGQLIGATGVNVEGSLYDVTFVDGTCIELFSGCDDPSDFTFATGLSATAASQALLDEVFIGDFDRFPNLTFGCGHNLACMVFTPSPVFINGMHQIGAAFNSVFATSDQAFVAFGGEDYDTSPDNVRGYADWTPSAVVAPEPGSLLLLGTGLLGAGLRRWRQKRS